MNDIQYKPTEAFALEMDAKDPLSRFRSSFHIPKAPDGADAVYLAGNSLGLQPKKTKEYINQELDDWAKWGVEGHFHAQHPWLPYHEFLTAQTARLVGAMPLEVVVMNSLTVNLHLMMTTFYRPTKERFKILIEGGAFPSDQYAVGSQIRLHGFDPETALLEAVPRDGEETLRTEDILSLIQNEGSSIALVMLGSVNYLTGQAFDIQKITQAAHKQGCRVGFDLAHGAGNLELKLHDDGPDFAVWCGYKYLNGGPGALSGCFVHERHSRNPALPRFAGWWGHNKNTRFRMGPQFDPIPGAEGWQLSNPPIFQLAALRASLELFDAATISALRQKSQGITGFMEFLLQELVGRYCQVITPKASSERGCQLSLRFKADPDVVLKKLTSRGIFCDFREPDIIRAAPTPLYNRYVDVFRFVSTLKEIT